MTLRTDKLPEIDTLKTLGVYGDLLLTFDYTYVSAQCNYDTLICKLIFIPTT